MLDILIRNGAIIDGTGNPRYAGDVGILDGRIVALGKVDVSEAETVLDASGKIVTPGFIDIHQHSDLTPLVNRQCESSIRQGVTLAVIGNCGHGCAPVSNPRLLPQVLLGYRPEWGVELNWDSYGAYLEALRSPGVAINLYPLVAHGVVRLAVMGFESRVATEQEIARMSEIVEDAMQEGAAGFSTGLEYYPGQYADTAELVALARVVGRHGGLYASHIRNRSEAFVEAVQEAITVGSAGSLSIQLSHLAPRPYAPPDVFDRVLDELYTALDRGVNLAMDTFPDPFGPGPLAALLPEEVHKGDPEQVIDRLRDPKIVRQIKDAFADPTNYLLRGAGANEIFLTYVPEQPRLMGKSLASAAQMCGEDVYQLVCDLLLTAEDNFYSLCLEHIYATKKALHRLMKQDLCALASDGIITAPYGPLEDFTFNSSSYGYTARVLGEYVRQEEFYTLEDAVRRMTGLPARILELSHRGLLREGYFADVVILDPETVHDNTTRERSNAYPTGVETVIVNGAIAIHQGKSSNHLDGRVLRRGAN